MEHYPDIRLLLIDLDGTLYLNKTLYEGVNEAIQVLREKYQLRFLTNTDSLTKQEMYQKLAEIGVDAQPNEIYTAVDCLKAFLKQKQPCSIFPVMSAGLHAEFLEQFPLNDKDPDFVVVSDCRDTLQYQLANQAFRALQNGAELIASQKGKYFFSSDGINMDTGAIVAMLEYSSSKEAAILGKPSPQFFLGVMAEAGYMPNQTMVIGDDITTDIAGGGAIGARTVLVRTGKFEESALQNSTIRPSIILGGFSELPALLGMHEKRDR